MHHNFLFDLDQTLLDFHASEHKALGIVLKANGLSFSEKIYQAFKAYNNDKIYAEGVKKYSDLVKKAGAAVDSCGKQSTN